MKGERPGTPTGTWVLQLLKNKDQFTRHEKDKMKEYLKIKKRYKNLETSKLYPKVRKKMKMKGLI